MAASTTTRHPIVADKDGGRQGERPHDFGHISAVSLNRALVRRARACAMPTQIDGDRLVARGQMRHLSVPVAVGAAKSVDEDDWRTALAGDDMVDEWHFGPKLTVVALADNRMPMSCWR